MNKQKSKRRAALRLTGQKTSSRNRSARAAERKATKPKAGSRSTAGQQQRSPETKRAESKQARIVAMLRSASGATIQAMTNATGWQQHSVRGFLAGVVRKRLGLNLVSAAAEDGRVYRIVDRTGAHVETALAPKRA